MRILSVTAHAFGPLRDETLDFAEGMTVVIGDNESAKSSWHAAVFAALCGRRRGKGRAGIDEQTFIDLHKPWDHDDWLVSARIVLDDGRDIEMRQDLAGKVDCHAKDLVLGRDVSSEIINDGAPDAAKWLGLDRSSFVATACVEQAQMLRVRDDAGGLQDHLQRAAATAGSATTAAKALERIDAYLKERVGRDRANSTKPLRTAHTNVQRAEHELHQRTAAHNEYLSRVARAEELRGKAELAAATVRAYEAAAAIQAAAELSTRASRARELHTKYGDTAPPSALDDDTLTQQVSEALTEWRSRPAMPTLPQPSSAKLKEEIDALPAVPEGDLEPDQSVLARIDRLKRASAQLEGHDGSRPSGEVPAPPVAADDDELLDLARTLEAPKPSVPPELIEREAVACAAAADAQRRGRFSVALAVAGVAAAIIGLVLIVKVGLAVGTGIVLAGVGLSITGAIKRHSAGIPATERELTEAQALLRSAQKQTADLAKQREQAAARCTQLGIHGDPGSLRAVPVARERAAAHQRAIAEWTEQHTTFQKAAALAAAELGVTLAQRGHAFSGSDQDAMLAAAHSYQQECRARADLAAQAARRADLVKQLASSQDAELRAAVDERARTRAADLVTGAAERCRIFCETAEEAAAALRSWLEQRTELLAELGTKQQEWADLQALLNDSSMVELEELSRVAGVRADKLVAVVDPDLLASMESSSVADRLPSLRQTASEAESTAATEAGELRQFAATIGSVAEAEEDLEKATAELERVQELKETLDLTRQFLEDAQTRVHRDIAPLLVETLRQWLPAVTESRYTDVMVDPKSLVVQVCGESRRWRDAKRLSYGTAEQIYLLLRVALADHLTKGHDTCPLLLDDVTVHADASRTRSILDLLLQVAADRQVVVFTQEEHVAEWARENLTDCQHAIRQLAPVAIA